MFKKSRKKLRIGEKDGRLFSRHLRRARNSRAKRVASNRSGDYSEGKKEAAVAPRGTSAVVVGRRKFQTYLTVLANL